MGAKRRKHKPRPGSAGDARERQQETIRVVNDALDSVPVDTAGLRKIAAVRGLVNNELRARAWPVLLGVEASGVDDDEYESLRAGRHRDASTVNCDVQRSLWFYTEGWSDEEREAERGALHGVLTAAVCAHPGSVHYYQGLHDIASVLLFVAGERAAFRMLSRMAVCQLRDCTRPALDAVLELLHLLMPLLSQADPELHGHMEAAGVPPYFALAWCITWFAHNVPSLPQIARLFDLLAASHPLMPLYVSAIAMQASRDAILACEPDPAELHRLLTGLPILGRTPADELAQQAVFLFKRCPPARLLALSGLTMQIATAPEADLVEGHYVVPQKKASPAGVFRRGAARLPAWRGRREAVGQAAAVVSVASVVALSTLALYVSKAWQA